MKFYHLSDKPFSKFKKPRSLGTDIKPRGLWLAPKGVWKKYIEEELSGEVPEYEYEVVIDMTNIITLETYKDISEFNKEFTVPSRGNFLINWDLVKKRYLGVYIKDPTIRKARTDFMWYSSFDIESICVWDKKCIQSVTLLDPDGRT